ncbi:hypothetical protein HPB47_018020 [Ixodes persulcatus]|uniref:Uncharacterized protein n=1 Tax=Ixodes persulcatus TaxID=34615 RepID=A0AC60QPF0_IXOPE|nr:hypothetical protein HPB47_018020 [Ixodes persulcatus]
MPPKDPNSAPANPEDDSDDKSRDTSEFSRALQRHTAPVEQVVAAERETTNQNFQRLFQENQRIAHESTTAMADALAAAVGCAISQNMLSGVTPAQSGTAPQPPPVAAFGGLRLQPPADTQSAFPGTTAPNTWTMGTQVEYQPSTSTDVAATAPPEPRVFAPYAAAADPGRFFVAPEAAYNPYSAYNPHSAYNPQVAGRQRVFTVADPPPPPKKKKKKKTRGDIAEAFVHVQQAARHSQHIGRREVAELQLLKCYVQLCDCRCIGLPALDKFRIFDRVRLLYHVPQSGWGAALEGYADPSASLLLGPLVPPRRPAAPRGTSAERGSSPSRTTRPNTRSRRPPKSPKKPKK